MLFSHLWRKSSTRKPKRQHSSARSLRLRVQGGEPLEDRHLLSVTLNPIVGPDANNTYAIPAGKTLYVPLTGTDTGQTISYQATSSDSNVHVSVLTGNPTLQLNVSGTDNNNQTFSGTMTLQLFQNLAPNMVQQIETLVNSGFYNDKTFYRVIPGFVAQGGYGLTGAPNPTSIGQEFNVNSSFNSPGLLAMANTGVGSSNTTEFFISDIDLPLANTPTYLNYGYTVFGQLTSGFDIYNEIMNAKGVTGGSNGNSSPTIPVKINSATIINDTQNGVLAITEPDNFTGSSQISVTATGSDNTTAQQNFTVTVAPDTPGTAPRVILAPIADQVTKVGQSVSFQISASDNANGTPQFGISSAGNFAWTPYAQPANVTVQVTPGSGNTATVTLTPAAGFTGTLSLVAHADDTTVFSASSNNYHDAQAFTLTVVGPMSVNTSSTQQFVKVGGSTPITGVSLTDPNLPTTDNVTFTLGAASGTLSLSTGVSGGLTSGQITGNGTGHVLIAAPLAAINATLAANGGLTYAPNSGFSGTDTFTFTASDTHGNSNTANPTVLVVGPLALSVPTGVQITPVNTALELTGISIADQNLPSSENVTLVLSVTSGTLNVSTSTSGGIAAGQVSGNGSTSLTITAPLAAINTTLGASSGLIYTPNSGFNGTDTLNLAANDGTGNSDAKTVALATGLSVVVPAPVSVQVDGSLPISGISLVDPALSSTGNVSVIFSVTHGTILVSTSVTGGVTGGQVTQNNSNNVTINATLAEVNATLAAAGLTYSPTSGYNGADTLRIAASDSLGTSSDQNLGITVFGPLSIVAPTVTQIVKIGGTTNLSGISLTDPSIPSTTNITLTLAVTQGQLTLATSVSGGLTSSQISGNGTGSVTVTAPLTAINTTLAATGGLAYKSTGSTAGSDSLSITASDPGGNDDSGSVPLAIVGPLTIAAPTTQQAVAAGGSLVLTGVSLADPSLPAAQNLSVTLTATHGVLNLSTSVTDGLVAGQITGNGSTSVTVTAPLAAINATLAAVAGLTYAPTSGYNGSAAVAIAAQDTAGNSANANINIAVGLTITAPASQTVGTGTAAAITGISIADQGLSTTANVTLTLSVTHGTITVSSSVTGGVTAAQITGNGSSNVTIVAPLSAINATLAASAGVNYQSTTGYNGADALALAATDPSSGSNTAGVALTVAGPLTVTTPSGQQSVATGGTLNVTAVSITDSSLPTTNNVTVTISASHGTLLLSTSTSGGVTSSQVSNNGAGSVTVTAPLAAVNATLAASGGLKYSPTSGYTGSDTIAVAGNDSLGNTDTSNVSVNVATPNTASLSGVVYEDANTNAVFDSGEAQLAGVIVTLTGTDSQNNKVGPIVVQTASDGSYHFTSLLPGTYTLTKSQPNKLLDGAATAGSLGGSVSSNDVISAIAVTTGATGTGYNFSMQGPTPELITINMFLSTSPSGKEMLEEYISDSNGSSSANIPIGTASPASAPTVSVATSSFDVAQNGTAAITGVSVADSTLSSASANVQVTLAVAHGTLNVASSVSGGVSAGQVSGGDSATVTVTAPIAAINTTLAASSGLSYSPTTGYTGGDTLSISMSDLGNNSSGTALTGSQSIALAVVGAPTVSTLNPTQTTTTASALTVTGVSIADPGLPAGENVTLSLSVASGTLNVSTTVTGGLSSSQISGNASNHVVITAPLAAINATLAGTSGLRYTPGSSFSGNASLSISATNSVGTSGTGSVSISVTGS